MTSLLDFDKQLLLWFNGSESVFCDNVIYSITTAYTWIPVYIAILYCIIKGGSSKRHIIVILLCYVLCFLLTEGVADVLVKPLVGRLRPTHDPSVRDSIKIVGDAIGNGDFSFFSAHSANTMGIAVFVSLLMRNRVLTFFMVLWSLLNAYSRLYLGVHYPGDVICGLIWGCVSALVAYNVYESRMKHYNISEGHYPTYTIVAIFLLTYVYIFVRAGILSWN